MAALRKVTAHETLWREAEGSPGFAIGARWSSWSVLLRIPHAKQVDTNSAERSRTRLGRRVQLIACLGGLPWPFLLMVVISGGCWHDYPQAAIAG